MAQRAGAWKTDGPVQDALFDVGALDEAEEHRERRRLAEPLREEFAAGPGRGLAARDRYAWVAEQLYLADVGTRFGIAVEGRLTSWAAPHPVWEVGLCEDADRCRSNDQWQP